MLAAATKPDDLSIGGGWQSDPKLAPVDVKQEQRYPDPPKRATLGNFFGADDTSGSRAGGRQPLPIAYSEEEQRAVRGGPRGGSEGARGPDLVELRKQVIAAVPTSRESVWSYPLKWDMLCLDSPEMKDKFVAYDALLPTPSGSA